MAAPQPVKMTAPQPVKMAAPVYSFPQPYLPQASAVPSSSTAPAPASLHAPAPATAPAPDLSNSISPSFSRECLGLPEHLMHKNRLQEYTQRSNIPLPAYQTINEGSQHAPKFRSTVWVDGMTYTSQSTFSHRKAAEQDVAKLAFECISKKIKDEGCPLVQENTMFCKSILNEYAVKLKIERPTYNTVKREGLLPSFVSSLVFNGVSFTGDIARNKKEAEQLAARAVILSILGESQSGTVLSEIIRSKSRLYAEMQNTPPQNINTSIANPGQLSVTLNHNETAVATPVAAYNETRVAAPPSTSTMITPFHEFQMPRQEPSTETTELPVVFVPSTSEQPIDNCSSSKRRKKNKKKANKKSRLDAPLPVSAVPLNQIPPCSVAQ